MSSSSNIRELGGDQLIAGGSSRGSTRCQDCGNQAKKNCEYMRCRTCCKRRGFDCETHIKSTWVPAYRRRHQSFHHHHHHPQFLSLPDHQLFQGLNCPKRLRIMNPSSTSSSPGLRMGNFPAEVTGEATFRCVKVNSIGGGDAIDKTTLAYQTAINVGGHIFRGILHYHGPAGTSSFSCNVVDSPSTEPPPPQHHHHHHHQQQPRYPLNVAALTTMTAADPAAAAAESPHPPPYPLPFSSYASAGVQIFPQYPKYND